MNLKQILIIIIDCYHMHRKRPFYYYKEISYVNWWEIPLNKNWFSDNLSNRFGDKCNKIRFYSVFGPRFLLKKNFDGVKVFFSGENIYTPRKHSVLKERKEKAIPFETRINSYGKNINKYKMSLALVSCTDGINNAIRFPYWMIAYFDNCYSLNDIKQRLDGIEAEYHKTDYSRKGAAAIASHDFFGTRTYLCDSLQDHLDITYGGKWRNNTNELWKKHSNNKKAFLAGYRFNICPENMDAKEYVTEKIWDSFSAGCIPIYAGALENPEPRIFNRESFILWSFENDNKSNIDKIKELDCNDEAYAAMKKQNIFTDEAYEYIFYLLDTFYKKIETLLQGKL